MSLVFEIQMIAILVALSCSLCGSFLVVGGQAMTSDALSHTILLGIVLGYLLTEDLNSPWLLLGATGMGVVTVWLTDSLSNTRLVGHQSSIGLIFPFLFALAILLISKYASSVHLDTDTVLLGELTFAPFDRWIVDAVDWGAKGIYSASLLLLANLGFTQLFFKELQLTTFDPLLASSFGFSPVLLHYSLMTLVSLTAVGSFQSVGSILVVAFMVGPSATALLLTNRLHWLLPISGLIAVVTSVIGCQLAFLFDVSVAGMISVVIGCCFAITFLFSHVKKSLTR